MVERFLGKEEVGSSILLSGSNFFSSFESKKNMFITGKGFDLELSIVDEFMTENPEFLSPEDPLAYALNKMHVGGFRHVPIVNDSMEPVGLISISNVISTIADYFSMEIINLPPLNRLIDSDKQEGG